MGSPRSFFDKRSQEQLVLPDTLVLVLVSQTKVGVREMLTFSVELKATTADLASFPKARQIRMENVQFTMQQPTDARIASFDFVATGSLTATIGLTCEDGTSTEVFASLRSDPAYLRPEYRGTTEEFVTTAEVASAELSSPQINAINALGSVARVYEAVVELGMQIAESHPSNRFRDLTNLAISEYGTFVTVAGPPRKTTFTLKGGPIIKLRICEDLETSRFIIGRSPDIKVEIQ